MYSYVWWILALVRGGFLHLLVWRRGNVLGWVVLIRSGEDTIHDSFSGVDGTLLVMLWGV